MKASANAQHNDDNTILSLIREPRTAERGFLLLVQNYQERLYWQIRRMVNWHDDADEVLQLVFIKAYKGMAKFRGDAKLSSWLYRIAHNETLTYLNKKKRVVNSLDDDESNISANLKADSYFDGNQAQIVLQEAIATLPEKQRAVFTMRYFEEIPYKELAVILDTSQGALKASYHHAVKKIEEYVKNHI